jgi:tetratricopeptide (TPR) repeat protein
MLHDQWLYCTYNRDLVFNQYSSINIDHLHLMDVRLAAICFNALVFEQRGDTESLSTAASHYRLALQLHQGPHRHELLSRLASTLWKQFGQSGKLDLLLEAISLHRAALQLRPVAHAERGESLNDLACAITAKSKHVGDFDLLPEAIALHREALSIRPPGHHNRASSLSNLAGTLRDWFHHAGNPRDLEESIILYREVLGLHPAGHSDRGVSLNGLAGALCMRFELNENVNDLDEAILWHREALKLRPKGHPLRSTSMSNLAITLLRRYEHCSDISALEESIRLLRAALKLQPLEHPDRSSITNNLAATLLQHSHEIGDLGSLRDGLSLQREVLRLRPVGHPERYAILHSIARTKLRLSAGFRPIANWTEIVEHVLEATRDMHASAKNRLRRTIETLSEIEYIDGFDLDGVRSGDILHIYECAVQLLPRAANFGLDISTRLRELAGSEELCRLASLRANALGYYERAIELLEEGRGVFWTQALRLRSPAFDCLPVQQRDELQELFNKLQQGSHDFPQQTYQNRADIERMVEQRRKLSARAERLIDTIREKPGFERFLMIQTFQHLRQAATKGSVVVLVETKHRCFALLMRDSRGPVQSILLRTITSEDLRIFSSQVSEWGQRSRLEEDRKMSKVPSGKSSESQLKLILQDVWTKAVGPIFDVLGLKVRLEIQVIFNHYELIKLLYRRPKVGIDLVSIGVQQETSRSYLYMPQGPTAIA